jgi:NAD(P)-dependent dehydrogenase (short-subunit alcohol dehydrogenase family)
MSGLTNLAGKVGVVTGGASGIGLGIARRMAAAGMKVVIADIEQGALSVAAAATGALAVRTDVSSFESVGALAERILSIHGAVHVVCNNAGIGPMCKIDQMSMDDWKWIINVNLWGVIHGVQVFLPLLKANPGGGHIVNTSSMSGLASLARQGPYSVTKFGIVALSEALAQELAEEDSMVGVSVLCPGPVRSRISTGSRNRPASNSKGGLTDVNLDDLSFLFPDGVPYLEADAVGDLVLSAVRSGDLYIFTHPELYDFVKARHFSIDQAAAAALRMKGT